RFNTRKSVDQLQAGAIVEHRIDAMHSVKVTGWRGRRGTEQFQSIPVGVQAPPTQPGGVISLARDYQGLDAQWIARTRLFDRPFTLTAGVMGDELQEARRGYQNFVGPPASPTLGVMGA